MTAIQEWFDDVLRAGEGSAYPGLHRMDEAGGCRVWIAKEKAPHGKKPPIVEERRGKAARSVLSGAALNRALRVDPWAILRTE
jgi:hypothetical protein